MKGSKEDYEHLLNQISLSLWLIDSKDGDSVLHNWRGFLLDEGYHLGQVYYIFIDVQTKILQDWKPETEAQIWSAESKKLKLKRHIYYIWCDLKQGK